ncbi:MAG: amidohydrolase family protein [Alphaproteobacteria bacterium]|nr:amidohydrolase family protein [Alphaproteobacteria bacterium]
MSFEGKASISSAVQAFDATRVILAPETLLTPDGPASGQILKIKNGIFDFVGSRSEFEKLHPGESPVEMPGCAIVPGFIDAHTHVGQAFGKTLTGGEPSQIWRRIWVPLESHHNTESLYASAKWMFLEALRGGLTTINNFTIADNAKIDAIHRAAVDIGIRLVSSTGSIEFVENSEPLSAAEKTALIDGALERAEAHMKACEVDSRISPSLCISGVQGASGDLMRALSEFCASRGALFQIHTNEHHVEVHWSVVRHGLRPLEYFAENGAVGRHTLHHHCALVTDSEIELLRETGSGVSYNPLASLWKGDNIAPALAFAARGVRFGIGSDSTRLDALRLLETAEACQRTASGMSVADFSSGAAWTWIDAATRGSADVTGLGGVTGELKTGLRADFLILDKQRPETLPSWDFEWELVRLYNRDQIGAVVVDGKVVMENGRATGWDQDKFIQDELPKAIETVNNAPIVRRHGPASEHRENSRR